jgi:hypothetical protein
MEKTVYIETTKEDFIGRVRLLCLECIKLAMTERDKTKVEALIKEKADNIWFAMHGDSDSLSSDMFEDEYAKAKLMYKIRTPDGIRKEVQGKEQPKS